MRNVEHIELRVAQIISTDKRKEILNVVLAFNNAFTVPEVFTALKKKGIDIKITSVLNVIKTLHFAGFLTEKLETRPTGKGGRPKLLYRVVEGIQVQD